jgi:cellulose biosynthesis protein BcsQ
VKVLATYNLKGGVGKTSAAVNLGALAARDGLRTLLWDLDPQGSATYLLRIKAKVRGGGRKLVRRRSDVGTLLRGTDVEGLDLLPSDFSYRNLDLVLDEAKRPTRQLRKVLAPLEDDYDLAILDCPPSISLASESVFDAADALLVPLIPATLSLRSFDRLVDFVEDEVARRPEIIAFFSMVDGRKRLHREVLESLPEVHREVIAASIPAASDVERMGVHRAAVGDFAPRGRAARAYAELWADVRGRLDLTNASGPS